MKTLIIEASILAAFNLGNTPFEKRPFQLASLSVERYLTEDFSVQMINGSRMNAVNINTGNPYSALWDVRFNKKVDKFLISIGHQSEHEVGQRDRLTESFDYVSITYREEF